jgi:hypothetical protein
MAQIPPPLLLFNNVNRWFGGLVWQWGLIAACIKSHFIPKWGCSQSIYSFFRYARLWQKAKEAVLFMRSPDSETWAIVVFVTSCLSINNLIEKEKGWASADINCNAMMFANLAVSQIGHLICVYLTVGNLGLINLILSSLISDNYQFRLILGIRAYTGQTVNQRSSLQEAGCSLVHGASP